MKARSAPEAATGLRFQGRLLGGCALHYNGCVIPEASFRRRRSLFLLLQLLLTPGHRLTRDQVLDLLWPDAEPEAAAAGLRVVLSDLRAACTAGSDDPSPILRRLDLIVLDPALDLHLDTHTFERAAESALHAGRLESMRAALDLYGGPLLPDLPYEDWAAGPRRRFADLHERLLSALVAREITADPLAAETHLRALLALDPTREDQARELLRLLATMGKRAEVRRVYEDLAAALRIELDVVPAPETTELYAALQALPDAPPPPARTGRLPSPVTTLIGRDRELLVLIELLDGAEVADPAGDRSTHSDRTAGPRLLTLTGSAEAWTAFPWPWSWRRRAYPYSQSKESRHASTIASASSPAAIAPRSPAIKHCAPPSTGATRCSPRGSASSCVAWPSLRAVGRSRQRKGSAPRQAIP